MTLIGEVVLLDHEFYPDEPERSNPPINIIGVITVVFAVIVSIYEVLMIIFALIKCVNHPARLVVVSRYSYRIRLKFSLCKD